MEALLTGLFDYQKYIANENLADVILGIHTSVAEARCLADSEVEIWAAGDALTELPPTERHYD